MPKSRRPARVLCRVLRQNGEQCRSPVQEGRSFTCWSHQQYEQCFINVPLCEVCGDPLIIRASMSRFCSRACRLRQQSEKAGSACRAGNCDRCGDWRTLYTAGKNYICEICGYCSDMPDRITPGLITAKRKQVPLDIVRMSLAADYLRELNAIR